jgi:hypothetical protein
MPHNTPKSNKIAHNFGTDNLRTEIRQFRIGGKIIVVNQHILGFINTSFPHYVHHDDQPGVGPILFRINQTQLFFIFIKNMQNEKKKTQGSFLSRHKISTPKST